ncbi:MAG: hypothetical protein JXA33_14315 [Anaerolineae bacterium]|nr:hypothetical protein [Anaerolineae bacterium]
MLYWMRFDAGSDTIAAWRTSIGNGRDVIIIQREQESYDVSMRDMYGYVLATTQVRTLRMAKQWAETQARDKS